MSILVMADIHGNLEALRAVYKDAAGDYDEIWVLGDIAGYGPDPGPCLDTLTSSGAQMVAGNHDQAVCGKITANDFNSMAKTAVEIHRSILSEAHIKILSELPEILKLRSVTLVHGNPFDPIWGYVLNDATAYAVLRKAETSLTLCGHSHIPGLWTLEGNEVRHLTAKVGDVADYKGSPHLANPGSVGQSRSGDSRARYMILDPLKKSIEFRGCHWRKRPLLRKMAAGGYPPALIERMRA